MSGNIYFRNIRRTIFHSMGRFIAIFAIIALGVGFFSGVKNTKASMMLTCDEYVTEYNMYDFRVMSTYGFTEEDVEAIGNVKEVSAVEGSVSSDFFSEDREGNSIILKAHSITDRLNKLELLNGRMPEADNECVADSNFFSESDIGTTVKVTAENDLQTGETLAYGEYKIVGIVNSPYYMMKTDRGTTSLGDGKVEAYVYMPPGGFTSEYFTEIFAVSAKQGFVFSNEYFSNTEKTEETVLEAAEDRARIRYDEIVGEAMTEIGKSQQELDDGKAKLKEEKSSVYGQLNSAKNTLDEKSAQISSSRARLKSEKASLNSQRQQVTAGIAEVNWQLDHLESIGEQESEAAEALRAQLSTLEGNLSDIDGGLKEITVGEKALDSAEEQLKSGYSQYYANRDKAEREFASAESELSDGQKEIDTAKEDIEGIDAPEIFLQTREDNLGFNSFESNADIIDSIAKIFPVFFFLIAALVCSTTMSRMIDEERSQIGALSAQGYTSGKIMMKYMIYSGSAAVIGCIIGFFAGSKYFPLFIWEAFGMSFGFAPLEFYFNYRLALISLVVSLLCSTGTTYMACRGQLKHMPAEILRPKAPKAGKRILLERFGFVWKHMKFLHKVTARNIFRYKKRMIMMVLGIGGCASLVMAGFGINDSVAGIADHQYSEVEKYHMAVAFEKSGAELKESFEEEYSGELSNTALLQQTSVNVKGPDATKSCSLMISDDGDITEAVSFTDDGKKLAYPEKGEAVINNKLAEMLGVEMGDKIELNYDDTESVSLRVSGIYRNYVSNYIYINDDTYRKNMGKEYEPSILFVSFKDGIDINHMSELINEFDGVMGISVNENVKSRVDDMMVSLNYIIILVIGCAGALAFIVIFNLGNINITEREREIATIEVLGFYPRETGSYVFRENFILVLFGIAAGLPAGFALHKFIMSRIVVDAVSFNEVIEPLSFLWTVLVVLGFSFIVDVILRQKLKRINMAEALKSIE